MKKDFDKWNNKKQELNGNKGVFYKEREVGWCSFGVNIGFEQDGTNSEYARPALIVRGFSRDVCLVIPLTTSKKKNKYHIFVGILNKRESFGIIFQIRLIDTKRLYDLIGVLDIDKFNKIRKSIRDLI